jgi:hypothetical protein
VGQGDGRALHYEPARDRGSDPSRGARDQRNPSFEPSTEPDRLGGKAGWSFGIDDGPWKSIRARDASKIAAHGDNLAVPNADPRNGLLLAEELHHAATEH